MWWLLLLLLIPFAIAACWRSVPRRAGSCGACKYRIEDLESFTCPECGHDLRYYGIKTSTITTQQARKAMLGMWNTAAIMTAYFIATLSATMDRPEFVRVAGSLTHDAGAIPPITFAVEADEWFGNSTLTLSIATPDGTRHEDSMQKDRGNVRTGVRGLLDGSTLQRPSIQDITAEIRSLQAAVRGFLREAGYDAETDDAVAGAASDVENLARQALNAPGQLDVGLFVRASTVQFSEATGTMQVWNNHPSLWSDADRLLGIGLRLLAVAGVWALGWFALSGWINRRNRSIRAAYATRMPEAESPAA